MARVGNEARREVGQALGQALLWGHAIEDRKSHAGNEGCPGEKQSAAAWPNSGPDNCYRRTAHVTARNSHEMRSSCPSVRKDLGVSVVQDAMSAELSSLHEKPFDTVSYGWKRKEQGFCHCELGSGSNQSIVGCTVAASASAS